jgi:hypothetical protein
MLTRHALCELTLSLSQCWAQVLRRRPSQALIEGGAPDPETIGTDQLMMDGVTVAVAILAYSSGDAQHDELGQELAIEEEGIEERHIGISAILPDTLSNLVDRNEACH